MGNMYTCCINVDEQLGWPCMWTLQMEMFPHFVNALAFYSCVVPLKIFIKRTKCLPKCWTCGYSPYGDKRNKHVSVMFCWNVKKTLTLVTANICSVRLQVVMKGDCETTPQSPNPSSRHWGGAFLKLPYGWNEHLKPTCKLVMIISKRTKFPKDLSCKNGTYSFLQSAYANKMGGNSSNLTAKGIWLVWKRTF